MKRRRRGHKGAGRLAKVLPAQVAAGAAPASARPPIFSNPLVPKSNGAAEGARRGRGAECRGLIVSGAQSVGGAECRGRNHFRRSVHTCRYESWLHDALASHGAPRGKDFGYRIGVGARGVGGTDSSPDALIDAQFVSLSSCLGYTGGSLNDAHELVRERSKDLDRVRRLVSS
jgi:hypothetical protein